MGHTKIINKTYDLLDEYRSSKDFVELQRLNEIINTKYSTERALFKKTFKRFDEIFSTGGKYHPDFKEAASDYAKAKKDLYEKEEVQQYFILENRINAELKHFSTTLSNSVSPYFTKKGAHNCAIR